jgi:Major Facilitator Superfamily
VWVRRWCFPSTLSLISNVFTERGERARAIGLWGAITGAAIALGPIVGGWLLQAFDWRSIFFAMTPIAVIAGVLVARYVPTSRDPHAPRTDRAGFALSTAMVGLLVYTIIEAPNHGWGTARTLGSLALTAVLAAAFVARERGTEHPMLDLSLFGNPRFTAASASVAISFFALSGFIFLVTQYFQFLKGYGPLSTGLRLLPVASCVAISSILGTRLAVRLGTKLVVASGLFAMAAFYLWVTTVSAGTRYVTIAAQMVVLGTGMGLTSAPATEAMGCGAEGQGRCRVRGQRRHAPARRHPRSRGDRQCVHLAVCQPARDRAPDRIAGHRRADRARIDRRRAHRRRQAGVRRPSGARVGRPRRRERGLLPRFPRLQLPRRRRCRRRRGDGAGALARPPDPPQR